MLQGGLFDVSIAYFYHRTAFGLRTTSVVKAVICKLLRISFQVQVSLMAVMKWG